MTDIGSATRVLRTGEASACDVHNLPPELAELIDVNRAEVAGHAVPYLPTDFEQSSVGGRGDSYRVAQVDPTVRRLGISTLLALAGADADTPPGGPPRIYLDVLGGDGTLARALPHLYPAGSPAILLTSDISPSMVAAAQSYGVPALRQAAQHLILRDATMDAVIFAYGTHHIGPAERPQAMSEAFRVLRVGGRVVLHDFESGSPVATWFGEVVDKYSTTGHRHAHFSTDEMRKLLHDAGFANVLVRRMYDPFVLSGSTEEAAWQKMAIYVRGMYGLAKIGNSADDEDDVLRSVVDLVFRYFRYRPDEAAPHQSKLAPSISAHGGRFTVEVPRVAIVATGVRGES